MTLHRRLFGALVSLALFSGTSSADTSERKAAILVEAVSVPKCYSLDCGPWPVPDDVHFCFQVGNDFYSGTYSPWGVPWATAGEKLCALEGRPVEIVVSDKQISVIAPRVKLRLNRLHNYGVFKLPSCRHA